MTNQQGAPEALRLADEFKICNEYDSIPSINDIAKAEAELRRLHAENERLAALVEAQQPAKAESLRQILTDPENQPNQYGVQFLMHGAKMAFRIGNRQFRLDYKPDEPGEFEFMRDALISAFSTFTPDVKMAQQPATHVQNPAEIEHVAGDVSKNGTESNMAQQPATSAAAATKQEGEHLFELWWSEYMPEATQERAWKAWTEAPRTDGVGVAAPTPQADSQPAPVRDESAAPKLLAMAINYPEGACWDKLDAQTCMEGALEIEALRAARAPADSVTAPAATPTAASIAWTALRDLTDPLGEAGVKIMGHVRIYAQRQYEAGLTEGRATPPTQAADSVLEDADPIRALIAEHAAILDQNESAYFELCYHRVTGWMAWITNKPLCMPPVVNPDRKVLARGQGDTADEACRDAARKQGGV